MTLRGVGTVSIGAPTRSPTRSACDRVGRRAVADGGACARGGAGTAGRGSTALVGPPSSSGWLWSISRLWVTLHPSRSHSRWSSSTAVRSFAGIVRPRCDTACTSVPSTRSTLTNESSSIRCATVTGTGPPSSISHTSPGRVSPRISAAWSTRTTVVASRTSPTPPALPPTPPSTWNASRIRSLPASVAPSRFEQLPLVRCDRRLHPCRAVDRTTDVDATGAVGIGPAPQGP